MHIRMRSHISGTHDGQPWPRPGGVVEVGDTEGAQMCAAGLAEPVADEQTPERAIAPPAEKRDVVPTRHVDRRTR